MIEYIKSFFTKKPKAYVVFESELMPSLVGMEIVGIEKNKPTKASKGKEFRTFIPLEIIPIEGGIEVHTKYINFKASEKLA